MRPSVSYAQEKAEDQQARAILLYQNARFGYDQNMSNISNSIKLTVLGTALVTSLSVVACSHPNKVTPDEIGSVGLGLGTCGNGVLEAGEQCDDGNVLPLNYQAGDYCSSDCLTGIDQTGTNCSAAAVQQLVQPNPVIVTPLGPTVQLPPGARIRLCDRDPSDGVTEAISIKHPVRIVGNGSEFILPIANPGITAVHVYPRAPNSTIENLAITYQTSASEHDAVAVEIDSSSTRLSDLVIHYAGTAIRAVDEGSGLACSTASDCRATEYCHSTHVCRENVNYQHFSNVMIQGCYRTGVLFDGYDSNGAFLSGIRIIGCHNAAHNAVGLLDSSFLGSTYVGLSVEGNDVGIKLESATQYSTFLGTYVEASDAIDWGPVRRSTVVGGGLAAREEVKGDVFGTVSSRASFVESGSNGSKVFVRIPFADQDAAFSFSRSDPNRTAGRNEWALTYDTTAPQRTHRWQFRELTNYWPALGMEVSDEDNDNWFVSGAARVNNQSLCSYVQTTCSP